MFNIAQFHFCIHFTVAFENEQHFFAHSVMFTSERLLYFKKRFNDYSIQWKGILKEEEKKKEKHERRREIITFMDATRVRGCKRKYVNSNFKWKRVDVFSLGRLYAMTEFSYKQTRAPNNIKCAPKKKPNILTSMGNTNT